MPVYRYFIAFILSLSGQCAYCDTASYTFAVVPQQSAQQLAKSWTPLLRYIHDKTGIKLQFRTAKDIPAFERNLAAGQYDYAYMNPYHFVVFHESPGYQALAVRKDQPIKGIIVVQKDSPIKTLAQLSNQPLAFPSPAAFAASLLTRAKFNQANIAITPKYVSSHDSVYLNVAKGFFPAGGGVMRTYNKAPQTVRDQLRVLWTTNAYTPHAFTAHPATSKAHREAIQTALTGMHKNDQGKKILQNLKIKHGLVAANNQQWDDVRRLQLDALTSRNN